MLYFHLPGSPLRVPTIILLEIFRQLPTLPPNAVPGRHIRHSHDTVSPVFEHGKHRGKHVMPGEVLWGFKFHETFVSTNIELNQGFSKRAPAKKSESAQKNTCFCFFLFFIFFCGASGRVKSKANPFKVIFQTLLVWMGCNKSRHRATLELDIRHPCSFCVTSLVKNEWDL